MMSRYDRVFLYFSALFLAALVTCNLIVQKFFETGLFGLGDLVLYPLGQWFLGESTELRMFQLSVGILPYPITFLVTDLVCEIYGKERANLLVRCGFVASLFTLGILAVASATSAMSISPVDNDTFERVFSKANNAIFASMAAYLVAQFIDIRLFHFWKKITRGKHLWLRNNASTVFSQFVDTTLVVTLLFWNDPNTSWDAMKAMILSGFLFKVIVALCDTPLLYIAVAWLKPRLIQDPPASP